MRAVTVDPGREEIGLADIPEPALASATGVKLRTLEVGVCGTDREIAGFQYGSPPPGDERLVLGHEALAEVVEVGRDVERFAPGDLAVPMVRRPCEHLHCRPCRAGRQDFCQTGDYSERGIKLAHGFMTELFVDEERYLHQVPHGLRESAVLVEPLTIAEKALAQVWEIQRRLPWADPSAASDEPGRGLSAVVLGAGPVAQLGAMALRRRGFSTWVYSRSPAPNEKADVAGAIGATYVSSEQVSPGELAERVGNIDLVYEGSGASKLAFEVLGVLGTNGLLAFTGVPGHGPLAEVDTDALMRSMVLRNQVALGTVNAGFDSFEEAISDLEHFSQRWPDAVRALISARHSIEEHRKLLVGHPGGIKHVIAVAEGA